jgi:hypothetical protein
VDRFIAALALGTLHGEMGRSKRYLSNQMPRTISPKPGYSLRYWRTNDLWATKKDVFSRLHEEAAFRLQSGAISGEATVVQGDARRAAALLQGSLSNRVSLVLTSPPYFDTTNFEEDQWLRLWLLGGPDEPSYHSVSADDRHRSKERYWTFLAESWAGIANLVDADTVFVCRLAGRAMLSDELQRGLEKSIRATFPRFTTVDVVPSKVRRRQTGAFRPGSTGVGQEVDFVYRLGYQT